MEGLAGKSPEEMEVLASFDGNITDKLGGSSNLPCLMKSITNHQPGSARVDFVSSFLGGTGYTSVKESNMACWKMSR